MPIPCLSSSSVYIHLLRRASGSRALPPSVGLWTEKPIHFDAKQQLFVVKLEAHVHVCTSISTITHTSFHLCATECLPQLCSGSAHHSRGAGVVRNRAKLTRHKLLPLYVYRHTQKNVKEKRQLEKGEGGGREGRRWGEGVVEFAYDLLRVAVLHYLDQSMCRHQVEGECGGQPYS